MWEYDSFYNGNLPHLVFLNQQGKKGWELASICKEGAGFRIFFKRKKEYDVLKNG